MNAWGHRALVCVLVVVGCLVAVGSGAAPAADAATVQNGDPAAVLNEADEVHVAIHVHQNRSATVVVDYRYHLNGDNESSVDWEELRADIESNPDVYAEAENESWQGIVERGRNETGREMALSNFRVWTNESQTPADTLGHVRFQFEWSSFAYGEPKYLQAGDALVGFTLVDDTGLTITWSGSYNATAIHPEPTMRGETSAHWEGSEIEFGENEPRVELVEESAQSGSDGDQLGWGISWQTGVVIGALAAAFVGAVGLAGWLLRRESSEPIASGVESTGSDEPTGGRETGPPPELLSNEEQVLRLLERHGGRLKQQQVVSELDWTEAKTSQVVTGLREAGEIEVFRMGRENVLVRSDENE